MKNRKEIEDLIIEYIYGEISEAQKEKLFKYIDEYPEYRVMLDEMNTIPQTIQVESVEMPGKDAWETSWNKIESRITPVVKKESIFSRLLNRLKGLFEFNFSPGLKFAGALALIMIGIFIGRQFFPSNGNNTLIPVSGNMDMAFSQTDVSDSTIVGLASENIFKKTSLVVFEFVNLDLGSKNADKEIEYLKESAKKLYKDTKNLRKLASHNKLEHMSRLFGLIEMVLFEIMYLNENDEPSDMNELKNNIKNSDLMMELKTRNVGV